MISVALATYNGEKYITEQLQSIYGQTRKVDEIVISDDCSTDATVELIKEFAERYSDCNIRLLKNETNLGYKGNFRKALELCEGNIIFLCDQDDVWNENKVEILEGILNDHTEVALISSAFVQIDGLGKVVSDSKNLYKQELHQSEFTLVPLQDLIFHNISQGCAMAFRKEIKESYLKAYTDELPHDWILNVVAAMQKKCYFINRSLFGYRIHDNNAIGVNDNMTLNDKNTLETRAFDAKQALKILKLIQRLDDEFYLQNPWLEEIRIFSENHVKFLQNKNLRGILLQNFNSCYKKLKTIRGRLLDIYFVLNK